jgi:hypothetical protein
MIFVRCKGGISHNPAESVDAPDVAVAIEVLARFMELLAALPVLPSSGQNSSTFSAVRGRR